MNNDNPDELLPYLYTTCLDNNFKSTEALNRLGNYYQDSEKLYIAMLCRLASLSASPNQREIFIQAEAGYREGILNPKPYHPQKPINCSISVIMSTYNRPDRIKDAIQSILDQTFQDFEILVINNGGNEDTREVIETFKSSKIRYQYSPQRGQYFGTNRGVESARGTFITYLDDDDVYFPDHLETLYGAITKRGVPILCGSNRWVKGSWSDNRWVETQDLTISGTQDGFINLNRLHQSCIIANLDTIHSRQLVEELGLYRAEAERGCDWEYWVRCSKRFPIYRLSKTTCEVRVFDIVPHGNPERARFYSILWPRFFGSAYGELVLAVSAWTNGDMQVGWDHFNQISTGWSYLDNTSLELLWQYGIRNPNFLPPEIWSTLADKHPLWLMEHLLFKEKPHGVRNSFTTRQYARMSALSFQHAVRNPRSSIQKLLRQAGISK